MPRNRVRAFRLMLEAARIGGMVARHNVGMMYQRGDGTERGVAKGAPVVPKRCRQGG